MIRDEFFKVVRMTDAAPDEVRGKLGYVIAWGGEEGEPPAIGVWVYDLEEVWSLEQDMITYLGYSDDIAAAQAKGSSIRVSVTGELLPWQI